MPRVKKEEKIETKKPTKARGSKSTTKKTSTKTKTTKKAKKTQALELTPNKAPIDILIPSQSGISPDTEIIVQTASTKSNILRVPVEQVEGKLLKTITNTQYFYPTEITANICQELITLDLLKIDDNKNYSITIAPEQLFFSVPNEESVQAQELVKNDKIKGLFSNFKVIGVHIIKNKYDRIYNFKNSTGTVMLGCGVLLNLGTEVNE